MTKKTCVKCKRKKDLNSYNFRKDRRQKDGFDYYCKECRSTRKTPKPTNVTSKVCSSCKKEKHLSKFRFLNKTKNYYQSLCKDCAKEQYNSYKNKNLEKVLLQQRIVNQKWRDRIRAEYRRRTRNRRKERMQETYLLRILATISSRITRATKGKTPTHYEKLLGYSIVNDLIPALELLFKEGMSWENYGKGPGKWAIDHIRPISSFSFYMSDGTLNIDAIKECWSIKNLQPLWEKENQKKGSLYCGVRYRYNIIIKNRSEE